MNKVLKVDFIPWALSVLATAIQTDELLQIVSLVLTCLSTLVILLFTIYKWWIVAWKDKKLTIDEINDLVNKITSGIVDIQDVISKVELKKDKKEIINKVKEKEVK